MGCKNQDTLKALKEKKNKRNDGNESNMEKTGSITKAGQNKCAHHKKALGSHN